MNRSQTLFTAAGRLMPGGVNSPVRAFRGVGGTPFFVARASAARIEDVDGRSYIDFLGSWGPLISAMPIHPWWRRSPSRAAGQAAVRPPRRGRDGGGDRAMPRSRCCGWCPLGTEAAMSAIRLARGATGRDLGEVRRLLPRPRRQPPHSVGGATFGVPHGGVPAALAAHGAAL
jgi:glutamate-1-semialdehyde 2,1-aminomutase